MNNKPTPPLEEALIALGGILADEETPCPMEIGDEIEDVIVALEEAQKERSELVGLLKQAEVLIADSDCCNMATHQFIQQAIAKLDTPQ